MRGARNAKKKSSRKCLVKTADTYTQKEFDLSIFCIKCSNFKVAFMSSIQLILFYLKKMGCICSRQTVKVEGVTYVVKETIGEG